MSLLSRNLKEEMDGECFVSSGKLFHALIVDGKKKLYIIKFLRIGETRPRRCLGARLLIIL